MSQFARDHINSLLPQRLESLPPAQALVKTFEEVDDLLLKDEAIDAVRARALQPRSNSCCCAHLESAGQAHTQTPPQDVLIGCVGREVRRAHELRASPTACPMLSRTHTYARASHAGG